jgi:DNA topoisomerase-3
MGKTLIVAEKPSVAGDIAKALGGFSKGNGHYERSDAIVSNARGHLIEIFSKEADEGGKSLNDLPVIPARFGLRPTKDAGPQLRHLVSLMKDPSITEVVNACDAGREGELIFRLIYDYAECRKPMRRMWLQSMTQDAIREAWKNMRPGADFQGLADSAYCRSEADWIMGINGTRGVTRLYERQNGAYELMSVGRVQTPTLSLVVERERAIRSFVPKDYWEVRGTFGVAVGTYVGTWFDANAKADPADKQDDDDSGDAPEASASGQRIFDKARADALVAKCLGVSPSKVTQDSKRSEEQPQRLFDLTSLQREANKRFRFSAKKTLDIAQALYETHKVTTYPRTDAKALPEDYVATATKLMGTFAGSTYEGFAQAVIDGGWVKPIKRIFDNNEISDHFAIIPTGTRPSGLDADEQRVYDLIVRRFIAAFYPNAVYETTTRITVVADETFRTSGRVMLDAGWRVVWGGDRGKGEAPALCAYAQGEPVRNEGVSAVGAKTKPPTRYTESSLLGAMEKAGKTIADSELRAAIRDSGLGTPATRASIIEGLLFAGMPGKPKQPYMKRDEQFLVPTEKGDGLYEFLTTNSLSVLTSAVMTAEWETKLLGVQKGELARRDFMAGINKGAHEMIDVLRGKASTMPEPTQRVFKTPCPKCGGELRGNRKLECSCGFGIWTMASARTISPDEMTELLTKRRTGLLKGFVSSKTKRNFDAILVLKDDFSLGFEYPSSGAGGGAAATALAVPCPKCKGEVRHIGGDYPRYACANGDFTLWALVSGRKLSEAEAIELIRDGSLSSRQGFISKAKKKFAAGLRMTPDYSKVEFVFDNNN